MKSTNEASEFAQFSDWVSWYTDYYNKHKKSPSSELVTQAEKYFFSEEDIRHADENYRDNLCERY